MPCLSLSEKKPMNQLSRDSLEARLKFLELPELERNLNRKTSYENGRFLKLSKLRVV